MKFFNIILFCSVIILLLSSFLVIVLIHIELWAFNFSLTPESIKFYLFSYAKYRYLFTSTIALCAAYFGLLKVKISQVANDLKLRQDIYSDWLTIFKMRFIECEHEDPKMGREIMKIARNLFNDLYELKFTVDNKNQLFNLIDKYFISKNLFSFFESQNLRQIGMGMAYPDDKFSYSCRSFVFLFFGMIDNYYVGMESDLVQIYIDNTHTEKVVGLNNYQIASQNYKPFLK